MATSRDVFDRMSPMPESRIRLRVGDRSYLIEPKKAFVFANTLILKREYDKAAKVLHAVVQSKVEHPHPTILLAYCQAALKNYAASHDLLESSFSEEKKSIANRLHDAFTYHGLGVKSETLRELAHLVNEYKYLPTICLILGDIFIEVKNQQKAFLCWKLALQRDDKDGVVAQAAQEALSRLRHTAG
jgi:hypothetical protein